MKDILPFKRLFIKTELTNTALITLSIPNIHNIVNVLRMKEGQDISVFNGSIHLIFGMVTSPER